MDVRIRVGRAIRGLRLDRGLSQEALAATADLHQTYLSDLENGKRNPSIDILARIALALQVDISDLFGRPS
ncbi:MAG: helix-turn-helix domain-containing protein [Bauldia sp.]